MVDATRCFFFVFLGCTVASRGEYQMARGRHYAKLSLSNAARLSFSDLCILLFMFLSLCRLCVCVFLCSHWSLVDVPLIFFCPADHVPDWQPRVLLGMVEARSVNVKKNNNNNNCRKAINGPLIGQRRRKTCLRLEKIGKLLRKLDLGVVEFTRCVFTYVLISFEIYFDTLY